MTHQWRRLVIFLTWNCVILLGSSSTHVESTSQAAIEDEINVKTETQLIDNGSNRDESISTGETNPPNEVPEITDFINLSEEIDEEYFYTNKDQKENGLVDNTISPEAPQKDHKENGNNVTNNVSSNGMNEENNETNNTEVSNSVIADVIQKENSFAKEKVPTIIEERDEKTNSIDSDSGPNEYIVYDSTLAETDKKSLDGEHKIGVAMNHTTIENQYVQSDEQESKLYDDSEKIDETNMDTNLNHEEQHRESIVDIEISESQEKSNKEVEKQTDSSTKLVYNNVDAKILAFKDDVNDVDSFVEENLGEDSTVDEKNFDTHRILESEEKVEVYDNNQASKKVRSTIEKYLKESTLLSFADQDDDNIIIDTDDKEQNQGTKQSSSENDETGDDHHIKEEKNSQNYPQFSSQDVMANDDMIDDNIEVTNSNDEQLNNDDGVNYNIGVKDEDIEVGDVNDDKYDSSIEGVSDNDARFDDNADIEVDVQKVDTDETPPQKDGNLRDFILNKQRTSFSPNHLDHNAQFVQGLTDIDKFLEEVDPPDELDVGADGSSIQEVLIAQGAQIIKTRFGKGVNYIQRKVIQPIKKRIPSNLLRQDDVDDTETEGKNFHVRSIQKGVMKLVKNNKGQIEKVQKFCRLVIHYVRKMMDDLGIFDNDEDDDHYYDDDDEYSNGPKKLYDSNLPPKFESLDLNQMRQKVMETRASSLNSGNINLNRENPMDLYKNTVGSNKPRQISDELQNMLKSKYEAKMEDKLGDKEGVEA